MIVYYHIKSLGMFYRIPDSGPFEFRVAHSDKWMKSQYENLDELLEEYPDAAEVSEKKGEPL